MDVTTGLILVIVFILTFIAIRRPRNLPPGPFTLPLIGSIFFIQKIRKNHLDRELMKAAKEYGSVMSFYIGPQLFVNINGYKLIHDAYVKNPEVFSGRPFSGRMLQRGFKTKDAKGVLFNDYNHSWRTMRRFTLQVLRDFGVGKTSIEEKILTEVSAVSTCLEKYANKPVAINIFMHYIVSNTIFGIIFGKRFDYDDPEFGQVIGYTRAAISGAGFFSLGNVLPETIVKMISKSCRKSMTACRNEKQVIMFDNQTILIGYGIISFNYDDPEFGQVIGYTRAAISGAGFFSLGNVLPETIVKMIIKSQAESDAKQIQGMHNMMAYARKQVNEHKATFDKSNIRDFIDLYLQTEQEETDGETKRMDKEDLFRTIMDLFLAGSDTTSSALDWLFLYMSEYPEVQKKCLKEMTEVLGDRTVSYSDRAKLVYVEATILEVQRMSCVLKESVPHCTTTDTTFEGSNIPKGTVILSAMRSVLHDPDYWTDPEQFRPERFIDTSGKMIRKDAMNPFSAGPRQCLGEPLAKMELFLVFANLLQRFEFKSENPAIKHSMESIFQHATNPPLPYKLFVVSRMGSQT